MYGKWMNKTWEKLYHDFETIKCDSFGDFYNISEKIANIIDEKDYEALYEMINNTRCSKTNCTVRFIIVLILNEYDRKRYTCLNFLFPDHE